MKFCLTTLDNFNLWSPKMKETGMPYRIHATGCKGISSVSEDVLLTADSIHELECIMWADQISEGGMTEETVKGTFQICPCTKKVI